ncbi:hypothetical protein GCM10007387_16330 [Pseudoduganella albidiflava]|uniref:PEP-CTERM sorting domain-containing protein n=2 Tax=Pseudoduganella albidiflava TaxID=321983 RepID=A0A411X821_9BURK|nr:PEP-CTERM sorting domain-containing protein [Pseudoduganella albidiflava]GGY35096.1 hypothetical protein GCM10007387_16330 [Pseudoduganella albidiflava]
MIKKMVCGAVLAAMGSLAQAAAPALTEWEFTWKGFYVFPGGGSGWDDPELTFTGRFAGTDGNSDGILALGELTSLTFEHDDYNYAACPPATATDECNLASFSYSEASGLELKASNVWYSAAPGSEAWWVGESTSYDTSYGIEQVDFGYQMPGEYYTRTFTDYTVKTVTQISPVPEPATYAMLGAGLLLLGAARKSRQKK